MEEARIKRSVSVKAQTAKAGINRPIIFIDAATADIRAALIDNAQIVHTTGLIAVCAMLGRISPAKSWR